MYDQQTEIFSSYWGLNEFTYKPEHVIPSDSKRCRNVIEELMIFVRRLYSFFSEYKNPWFASELLGLHIINLRNFIEEIVELTDDENCKHCDSLLGLECLWKSLEVKELTVEIQGKSSPPVNSLSNRLLPVDIVDRIRQEFKRFRILTS